MTSPGFAPGFQGSRNTTVDISVYGSGMDPLVPKADGVLQFKGRANVPRGEPAVTNMFFSKSLGAPSGTLSMEFKVPDAWGDGRTHIFNRIVDDDWIDVVVVINGVRHHLMRGLVGTIREVKSSQGGSPVKSYSLTATDHGNVLMKADIWFNKFKSENAANQEELRAFKALDMGGPSVPATIQNILEFALAPETRPEWTLPRSMPNGGGAAFFDKLVQFTKKFPDDFDPIPARRSLGFQMDYEGATWALLQEWADPMFCELVADLGPADGSKYFALDRGYDETQTEMRLILRDKPFPATRFGLDRWKKIPVFTIPEYFITNRDIGLGGGERYNAFYVSPLVIQGLGNTDLNGPLWDLADIKRHGLRRFNVESRYSVPEGDLSNMSELQRTDVRDFNCLNPYLFTGSIQLGAMFPQLRVGMRLRVQHEDTKAEENYYVEQVTHSWSASSGGRTNVVVTRGWVGGDDLLLQRLREVAGRYSTVTTRLKAEEKAVSVTLPPRDRDVPT